MVSFVSSSPVQNFSDVLERHQNLSKWQACKLTIKHMHAEGTLWKNTALAIVTLVFSVLTAWLAITGLINILDIGNKLSNRTLVVNSNHYPFTIVHLLDACLGVLVGVPLFGLIPLGCFSSLKENVTAAYFQALRTSR